MRIKNRVLKLIFVLFLAFLIKLVFADDTSPGLSTEASAKAEALAKGEVKPSASDTSQTEAKNPVLILKYENGKLDADIQSASIKDIFEELKKQLGLTYEIEKEIQEQKVTISFKEKELTQAIKDILNTIGNPSYMINYKKNKDGRDEIAGINITKRGKEDSSLVSDRFIDEAKMIELIKDKTKDKFERISAIGKLGKMKAKDCCKDFEELLKKDEDGDIRMALAIGLGLIGDKESIPVLKETLKDKEKKVSLRAAYMLGKMNDDSGYNLAKELVKDNEPINREYAVEALGIIGKEEAKPLIEEAKKDKNVWVQIKANIAEKNIEVVKLSEVERTKFLRNILNNEKQIQMQIWAANSLVEIGDAGIEVLREIVNKSEDGAYVAQKQLVLNEK